LYSGRARIQLHSDRWLIMQRFLSTSFIIFALVVGTAGFAPAVHAQTATTITQDTATAAYQQCQANGNTGDQCQAVYDAYTKAAGVSSNPADASAAAKTPAAFEGSPQMDSAFAKVMNMILSLFAWLLTAAMITLNYAVYYTVIKMGDYVHGLAAVGVTWRILRDVANIMFIFGFLGAGIATILNVDQYGWKTKMLPMLLVGAVFLNFSLFITEAMIDTTNLVATQFYTQINGGTMPTKDTLLNEGLSGKIMQQLGFPSIYNVQKAPDVLTAKNSLFVAFMGIILFIVTAFVMFSLAFILIARFVALIFFIILCPVGFMGLAIPWMQYRAGQWWTNFLDQIITAPVLLLLLYVALAVITDAQFLAFGSSPNWLGLNPYSNTPANMAGFAGMLLSFLIAMGLLLMVVIKAKSMSAFGAGMATKAASRLSGATLVAAGAAKSTRWVGRKTLGWAGTTRTGKALGMGGLANASFDFRNSKLAKTAQTRAGLDLGTGGKGGYKTYAAEQQKSERKKLVGTNLKQAEGAEKVATKAHSQIQAQHDIAAAEYAKQKAEVERLEEEKSKNKYFEAEGKQAGLDAARAAAATSKASFEASEKAMAGAEASLKGASERAERMREKMEKTEERAELQELKDALKEGAVKASAERGTEKKEAKAEEKK
jgi:hypothetical protein